MIDALIMSLGLLVQPNALQDRNPLLEGSGLPPTEYSHFCVVSSTGLMAAYASDNDIEIDEHNNYVIRDALTPEGHIVEVVTLRGNEWNCSSVKINRAFLRGRDFN